MARSQRHAPLNIALRIAAIACLIIAIASILLFATTIPFYFWGISEDLPWYPVLSLITLSGATLFFFLFALSRGFELQAEGQTLKQSTRENLPGSVRWLVLALCGPLLLLCAALYSVRADLHWGTCSIRACLALKNEKYDLAAERFKELIVLSDEPIHLEVAQLLRGYTLSQGRRHKEAIAQLKEAVATAQSEKGRNSVLLADSYMLLGDALRAANEKTEGEAILQKAIATIKEAEEKNERTTELRAFKFMGAPINLPSAYPVQIKLVKLYIEDNKLQESDNLCSAMLADKEVASSPKRINQIKELQSEISRRMKKIAESGSILSKSKNRKGAIGINGSKGKGTDKEGGR